MPGMFEAGKGVSSMVKAKAKTSKAKTTKAKTAKPKTKKK